jgi:hypothetical protein
VGVSRGGPKPAAQPAADAGADGAEVVEFPGRSAAAYGKPDEEPQAGSGGRVDETI